MSCRLCTTTREDLFREGENIRLVKDRRVRSSGEVNGRLLLEACEETQSSQWRNPQPCSPHTVIGQHPVIQKGPGGARGGAGARAAEKNPREGIKFLEKILECENADEYQISKRISRNSCICQVLTAHWIGGQLDGRAAG